MSGIVSLKSVSRREQTTQVRQNQMPVALGRGYSLGTSAVRLYHPALDHLGRRVGRDHDPHLNGLIVHPVRVQDGNFPHGPRGRGSEPHPSQNSGPVPRASIGWGRMGR